MKKLMHIQCLSFVFLFFCEISQSKEKSEDPLQAIFAFTYWEPNKGVKLLKPSGHQDIWEKYKKKCELPDFDDEDFPIKENLIFKTDHLIIFVYNIQMKGGPYWTICKIESKEKVFDSKSFASGYEILEDDSIKPFGPCRDDPGDVHVRFKPYEKNKLMLEMNFHVCQQNENHHEFLFHLDREDLVEVEGSRFVLHDDVHGLFIRWVYSGKNYSQLGKTSLNEEGGRIWTRRLEAALKGIDGSRPLWEFNCRYEKAERKVKCEKTLIKGAELSAIPKEIYISGDSCKQVRNKETLLSEIESVGFHMTKKVKNEILNKVTFYCK